MDIHQNSAVILQLCAWLHIFVQLLLDARGGKKQKNFTSTTLSKKKKKKWGIMRNKSSEGLLFGSSQTTLLDETILYHAIRCNGRHIW